MWKRLGYVVAMSVSTGDIVFDKDLGVYLLIGEPCTVEEGEEVFDAFYIYNFDKCMWGWYYACFLEDEVLYQRIA